MAKPYSVDLRERVVAAVEKGGLSRREAASQFGVGISTASAWVRSFRATGSIAPGQMGGHKPKAIRGEHQAWLAARIREKDFTLRGLVAELAAQWREVADQARPRVPKLAALMDDAETDVLAYMGFPAQHRAKLHSTNPLDGSTSSP